MTIGLYPIACMTTTDTILPFHMHVIVNILQIIYIYNLIFIILTVLLVYIGEGMVVNIW